MTTKIMQAFGDYIRELRTGKGLLMREAAAKVGVDPSLLSRIERGEKRATREQVLRLARVLGTDEDDLMVHYLSDRVVYELQNERLALKACEAAERKIAYLIRSQKIKKKDD